MEEKWFCANRVGNIIMMKECIVSGININIRDNAGHSAIHYAIKQSNMEILSFLLSNGASVDNTDINGNTPLIIACSYGDTAIAKILIGYSCDVNVVNKNKNSALFYAIHENTEISSLLLENGADITLKDKDGDTALLIALKNGYTDIVDIFLKKYTDTTIKTIYAKRYNIINKSKFMANIENNIKMDKINTICLDDTLLSEYKNKMIIYSIGLLNN